MRLVSVLTAVTLLHPAARAQKPNFVFILVDDLGWMDIGAYNPETFYETPNVDRLAATGMRFTNAYAACPVCSPTRASILSGKYPARLHTTDRQPGQQEFVERTVDTPALPEPRFPVAHSRHCALEAMVAVREDDDQPAHLPDLLLDDQVDRPTTSPRSRGSAGSRSSVT